MSSFFSLKNKLGLISFLILALNVEVSQAQANSTEEAIPEAEYDSSSPEDLVILSIHEVVVMVKEPSAQKNKSFTKPLEKEFKLSLKTSRKEVKEENIRKLRSSLPACHTDLPQE